MSNTRIVLENTDDFDSGYGSGSSYYSKESILDLLRGLRYRLVETSFSRVSYAVARNAAATAVLAVVGSFCALVLGVTLYAITRQQDRDLALLGLGCRLIEAVPGHGAIYAVVGTAVFSWLLLRGRMIPIALASFGLIASVLVVMLLLLQIAALFGGPRSWSSPVTWAVWLPLLIFQLALAFWLIAKGVAHPRSY